MPSGCSRPPPPTLCLALAPSGNHPFPSGAAPHGAVGPPPCGRASCGGRWRRDGGGSHGGRRQPRAAPPPRLHCSGNVCGGPVRRRRCCRVRQALAAARRRGRPGVAQPAADALVAGGGGGGGGWRWLHGGLAGSGGLRSPPRRHLLSVPGPPRPASTSLPAVARGGDAAAPLAPVGGDGRAAAADGVAAAGCRPAWTAASAAATWGAAGVAPAAGWWRWAGGVRALPHRPLHVNGGRRCGCPRPPTWRPRMAAPVGPAAAGKDGAGGSGGRRGSVASWVPLPPPPATTTRSASTTHASSVVRGVSSQWRPRGRQAAPELCRRSAGRSPWQAGCRLWVVGVVVAVSWAVGGWCSTAGEVPPRHPHHRLCRRRCP